MKVTTYLVSHSNGQWTTPQKPGEYLRELEEQIAGTHVYMHTKSSPLDGGTGACMYVSSSTTHHWLAHTSPLRRDARRHSFRTCLSSSVNYIHRWQGQQEHFIRACTIICKCGANVLGTIHVSIVLLYRRSIALHCTHTPTTIPGVNLGVTRSFHGYKQYYLTYWISNMFLKYMF